MNDERHLFKNTLARSKDLVSKMGLRINLPSSIFFALTYLIKMLSSCSYYILLVSKYLYLLFQILNNKIFYEKSLGQKSPLTSFLWYFHDTFLFFLLVQLWLLPTLYVQFFAQKGLIIFLFSLNLSLRSFIFERSYFRLVPIVIGNFIGLEYLLFSYNYSMLAFISFFLINLGGIIMPFKRKTLLWQLGAIVSGLLLWFSWQLYNHKFCIDLARYPADHCESSVKFFLLLLIIFFPLLLGQYLKIVRIVYYSLE